MIIGRQRHCTIIQLTHQTIRNISLDADELGPKERVDRIVDDLAQEDKNHNVRDGECGGRGGKLVDDPAEEERRDDVGDACE